MLTVAICDDEKNICIELESLLTEILSNLNVAYEIDVYFSGDELYQKMESGLYYDLIFLDIVFATNEINGVEVGRRIREVHENNAVSIVYISWEKKYTMQLFDIRPLNFLVKPLLRKKVEQVIRTHLNIAGLWSENIVFKKGQVIFKVQVKNILYIESRDRKLILYLTDGKTESFYGSLRDIWNEQLRSFDFLYIHAAYAVNYDYVSIMKYNQIFLSGITAPLPISQNKRNEVRERYYLIMKRRRGTVI